jgi:hypothetical protein
MSAFVVEPDTLSRVAWAAEHYAPPRWRQRVTELLGLPCDETWGVELQRALHRLNVSAVCQRYPADRPEQYPFRVGHEVPPTLIQGYKALQCLVYQCYEGDVPGTPLYGALVDLEHVLAARIVSELPAYEAAPWG